MFIDIQIKKTSYETVVKTINTNDIHMFYALGPADFMLEMKYNIDDPRMGKCYYITADSYYYLRKELGVLSGF